jgi:undecaprenyl-diphosphatase
LLLVADAGHRNAMTGIVALLALGHFFLRRRFVRFFLAVMLCEPILEHVSKRLIGRARPDVFPLSGFDSYPSGHVLGATVLVGALLSLWLPVCRRRWQQLLLWGSAGSWVTLMAAARVYMGRHYLTDVVGGVWLGASWVFLCRAVQAALARPEPGLYECPPRE